MTLWERHVGAVVMLWGRHVGAVVTLWGRHVGAVVMLWGRCVHAVTDKFDSLCKYHDDLKAPYKRCGMPFGVTGTFCAYWSNLSVVT